MEKQTKLSQFNPSQTTIPMFDVDNNQRATAFDNLRRFNIQRTYMIIPHDSFEEDLQRDFNRFYKDINMNSVKNRQTLEAEIRRVATIMKKPTKSNNTQFLVNASNNYLNHMQSLIRYFAIPVYRGGKIQKGQFRDSLTGKFLKKK